MPSNSHVGSQMLMFPLRLSKDGATDDAVTINTVLYRKQVEDSDSVDCGET